MPKQLRQLLPKELDGFLFLMALASSSLKLKKCQKLLSKATIGLCVRINDSGTGAF